MCPVWANIEATVDQGGYGDLHMLAGHLGLLPVTQPAKTLELLGRIQYRLDELGNLAPVQRPVNLTSDAAMSALFGMGEIDRTAVERRLAIPYGACAVNSTEGLETALNALWELGRRDSRPVESAPDHPMRIIIDRLCQVNRLPDLSYPERIIAKAGQWLASMDPRDAVTPLTIFAPFLVKEGTTSEMQDTRAISLGQYQIKPSWARPHRDAIRALCVKHATDDNLPLTAEIVRLLEGAIQPPRGYYGANVPDEQRNAWADDDLQTITTLRTIAESTTKSALRRLVCRAVEIPAGYSTSPEVMHAALSLLHQLDQREDDDLSDQLLGGGRLIEVESQRGKAAPTLSECAGKVAVDSKHSPEGEAEFNNRLNAHEQRSGQRLRRVAQLLWGPTADIRASIDRLDAELRDVLLTSKSAPSHQLITFLQHTARQHAERASDIVAAILDLPDGPLDDGLPILLDELQSLDRALIDRIVAESAAQREGVRWAIGRAAGSFGWATLGAPYTGAITDGVGDPSERVRQAFLRALPFVEDPITVSNTLIALKATDDTIYDILRTPPRGPGVDWYRNLNYDQAVAVLDLIAGIQVGNWGIEQPITTIAMAHPRLVLDRMTGPRSLHFLLRNLGDHNLRAAYSGQPHEVVAWILDGCKGDDPGRGALALVQVVGDRLPRGVLDELCAAVSTLVQQQLENLLELLASLNAWAAHHIELARRLTEHARTFGEDVRRETLNAVSQQLTPHFWSGNDSGSPQLQSALAAIERALGSETNDELRHVIAEAQRELQEQIHTPVPDYFDEL